VPAGPQIFPQQLELLGAAVIQQRLLRSLMQPGALPAGTAACSPSSPR
jgi:hypothetical protein